MKDYRKAESLRPPPFPQLSELQSLLRDPDPGVRALAAEEEAGLSEQVGLGRGGANVVRHAVWGVWRVARAEG